MCTEYTISMFGDDKTNRYHQYKLKSKINDYFKNDSLFKTTYVLMIIGVVTFIQKICDDNINKAKI